MARLTLSTADPSFSYFSYQRRRWWRSWWGLAAFPAALVLIPLVNAVMIAFFLPAYQLHVPPRIFVAIVLSPPVFIPGAIILTLLCSNNAARAYRLPPELLLATPGSEANRAFQRSYRRDVLPVFLAILAVPLGIMSGIDALFHPVYELHEGVPWACLAAALAYATGLALVLGETVIMLRLRWPHLNNGLYIIFPLALLAVLLLLGPSTEEMMIPWVPLLGSVVCTPQPAWAAAWGVGLALIAWGIYRYNSRVPVPAHRWRER